MANALPLVLLPYMECGLDLTYVIACLLHRVNVHGINFAPGDIYCRFEKVAVTGSFVSRTTISCIAPPSRPEGQAVTLSITNSEASYISSIS